MCSRLQQNRASASTGTGTSSLASTAPSCTTTPGTVSGFSFPAARGSSFSGTAAAASPISMNTLILAMGGEGL